MTSFLPPCCPNASCVSHHSREPEHAFRYRRRGTYRRACDGAVFQRYLCRVCGRSFSEQTFSATYRQKLPWLNAALFKCLVSKVTHRQAARELGVNKNSVSLRIPLLGRVARAAHETLAARRDPAALGEGGFLFDELETYARSRRNNPVTLPVLIDRESFFVVHAEVGPLPRRGGRGRDEREPEPLGEAERQARSEGSKRAVTACLEALGELVGRAGEVLVRTDEKVLYGALLKALLADRVRHERTSSQEPRDTWNPLFRINLTLAMLRDGVSRLVRRSWGASKLMARLGDHVWCWIGYRNYVRGVTNQRRHVTPGMLVGACPKQLEPQELLRWRPEFAPLLLVF